MGRLNLDTMAEVGTIALGLAVVVGLALRWPKPGNVLDGTWEARTVATDGTATARRLTFSGPNAGWWRSTRITDSGATSGDSLAFSIEGPRDNRFCVRLEHAASTCMVLMAFGDSLVVDSSASNATASSASPRLVFHPVR